MASSENLVWIDLEMTGLNPAEDSILEIATIVTDKFLNIIATGPNLFIFQPPEVLNKMSAFVKEMHEKSGLTQLIHTSKIQLMEAERLTLEFLEQYVAPGSSPLCGNSIWQDRRFIARYMPALDQFLHYRVIDVSTLKELARRWNPEVFSSFQKKNTHRALDDIKESIEELKHYKEKWFAHDNNNEH